MLFKKSQTLNVCAGPPFLRKLPSPYANGGVGQVEKAIRIDGNFLCFDLRGYRWSHIFLEFVDGGGSFDTTVAKGAKITHT